ncbi:MAG: M3 family oligoendopeptidase [Baekduia sp.]
MADTAAAPTVEDIAWDLEPLVHGEGPEGALRLLREADERAAAFAAAHAGKVAEIDGAGLAAAVAELTEISDLIGRAGTYASLRFSVDTVSPENGKLIAQVQELGTQIETKLLFFELEWAELSDERVEDLLSAGGLETVQHHLRSTRRYRPHLLTEPEERIVSELDVTGSSAWSRLFSEVTTAIEVSLDTEEQPITLDMAAAQLTSPDRAHRKHVAEQITEALAPTLRIRAYIFNTLLAGKATGDRLRSYDSWISSRNLANETSDEAVAALVEAVRDQYELARRWYRLKAKLLGLDRLADYDRLATVAASEESYSYEDGKALVLDAFGKFSPVMADGARRFFDEGWIDVPPRQGKRGGAFCSYAVPSAHPYLMLNWTNKMRDVTTLAHEMGHGLHAYLAQDRGIFEFHTPLTMCETASVFGEALVFSDLLERTTEPEARLALLAENIEGSIATVFRQVGFNRFEELVHTERRTAGELSVDRFGELWLESSTEMFGDSIELSDGYERWWSYIPHFIGTPGYVYAYAFGQLLALSVYGRYAREGEAFVPAYLEMLSAGGSKSPEELVAIAGLDLTDPGFWRGGLALVEQQLVEAEKAAEAVLAGR